MFGEPRQQQHMMAGRKAAAASSRTPAHLRKHQKRLAMGRGAVSSPVTPVNTGDMASGQGGSDFDKFDNVNDYLKGHRSPDIRVPGAAMIDGPSPAPNNNAYTGGATGMGPRGVIYPNATLNTAGMGAEKPARVSGAPGKKAGQQVGLGKRLGIAAAKPVVASHHGTQPKKMAPKKKAYPKLKSMNGGSSLRGAGPATRSFYGM